MANIPPAGAGGPSSFAFPNYASAGIPDGTFPFTNYLQQLTAGFNAFPTNSYGRWNGTGVSQPLGYPSGINPGPANGYPMPQPVQQPMPQGGQQPMSQPMSQPQSMGPQGNAQGLLGGYYNDLPQGATIRPTSGAASGMTQAEQNARAMLPYASNQMGLYSALGQEMAARGMSQDQIAAALNSFGGTAGANGGAQINQLRQQFGTNYGNAFAGTPFAQFFANRNVSRPAGGSMNLPGLLG